MGIIWTIVIGFVAGVIAKFIMPGSNEPSGFVLTTILGIVGAIIASYLGQALGWYAPGEGAVLGKLGGLLGGASAGSVLSGGLGDLIERFRQNGHGQAADSWVRTGPNQPLAPDQLEQAIGPDVLNTLSQQTGLSRDELVSR